MAKKRPTAEEIYKRQQQEKLSPYQRQQQQQHQSKHWYQRTSFRKWSWFQRAQVLGPMLPVPIGFFLLYKAYSTYFRSPPPLAVGNLASEEQLLNRPLYAEPVYQRVSFAPSTFVRNATPRGGGGR